ncbi:hypothetical protein D3C80_1587520 [compost metagenome]
MCTNTKQLHRGINSRVTAPDNRYFHTGIRMGFAEIVSHFLHVFPGYTEDIRMVEVTGGQNDMASQMFQLFP